jgi:hypothetical protein
MPAGRPTKYTEKLALEICSRIPNETLREICKDEHIPTKTTIFAWLLDGKHKEFSDQYDKAMEIRVDNLFDEIEEIADDSTNDYMERQNRDGSTYEVLNSEHVQRSRLRIDTKKWKLQKLEPKKYGDRLHTEHSGSIGMTLLEQIMDDEGEDDQTSNSK